MQLLSPSGGFPADLQLDGKPAREGPLSADDARPSTLTWHGLTMVVLPRGGRFALRIKDADASTRKEFKGLHWYAPDARFRVTAKWLPYNPPHVEKIPTVIGTSLNMVAPGMAEFTFDGKTLHLEPVFEGGERDKLFFHSARRHQPDHNLPGGAVPARGAAQPRSRRAGRTHARFQRAVQPAMRLHAVRDVPVASGTESPAGRD